MFPTFCRITGHSRGLPKTNYCPLLPPISPKDAKRFISGCRITCNFNPDHHYVPITKLILDSVIKCRITEKSVYEYKYYLQPNFGGCSSNSQNAEKVSGSSIGNQIDRPTTPTDHFYYILDNKILILPKSVEKELNSGVIKDVQISEDDKKIGFRYINTIKEYDLIVESTDKLQELNVVKGKGLKKNVRKRRKQSALLGDLKAIFEQKEKLAEMAEKKSNEKIQADASKIELVKSKIIQSKAPIFGYMDHNNKFTEVNADDELPKHVIKGQMKGGIFTPGELINDIFIPGKYIETRFTPGIIKDGDFVPGHYIKKEVNGQLQQKFICGKILHGTFTPGQMIKTKDGSRSEWVPGQVLTLPDNQKKFVPGLLIEQLNMNVPNDQNDVLDVKFVPGKVEEKNNTLLFMPGELCETNEGLKFICDNVEQDSFEIQTFDNTYDFDYEDVKAAAAAFETLHEFVRHDKNLHSSFDLQDCDTRSMSTTLSGAATTNENSSRKASIDFLDTGKSEEYEETIICAYDDNATPVPHIDYNLVADKKTHQQINLQCATAEKNNSVMAVTSLTILEKMKEKAACLIQKICLEMNLSAEETAGVVEKGLQALKSQQEAHLCSAHSSSDEMKIELPDTSTSSAADLIFEKVTQQVASVIQPVFAQLKIKSRNVKCKPETVAKVLKELVAQEIVESLVVNQSQVSKKKVIINFDKVKQKASTIILQCCAKMAKNTGSIDPATLDAVEKVVLEVIKENALQSAVIMTSGLMDLPRSSLVVSTLQTSQKAKQDVIIQKLCSQLKLKTSSQEMSVIVEKVLQEFSDPQVLRLICDEIVSESGNRARAVNAAVKKLKPGEEVPSILLKESASTEKVLEDCKKLLVEGYHHEDDFIMGESEVKAADMLKDHVENQLTRDFNEALLEEAVHLAQVMGKLDVVRELELLLQDDLDYETVVNDSEVLFILRQLVILKKLMAAKKTSSNPGSVSFPRVNGSSGGIGGESGKIDLNTSQELIRDSQILTEYVFAQEERERYYTPPCEEVKMLEKHQHAITTSTTAAIVGKKFQTEGTGVAVYTEESSSFFSSADGTGTVHSKRARLTTDDPEFDDMIDLDPVELLDNSFARHKIEMARSRHLTQNQKKSKIALKSADELQATTSEQLALINREATLRELIETEEEFVRDLNYVIENYYKALGTGNKLAKYRDLFGSLKPVYEFHQGILLEGFRYYINEPKMIGRTFLRLERYFDHHAQYISEEEPNAQALLRDDLEICSYFEDLTLSLGDEKSLSDHLKLPLQRINDYQLILQDLIDIQRILKEDTTDLEKALDLLLSIPQKVSDKKFLSSIEGFHGSVANLGRLLRHDWFTVTREDVNEVKQRYAFLFKSRILVTKVRKISEERSVFILKDIIKLPEYSLEQVNHKKFILKGTPRVYIFETPSEDIASEWCDILQQCLQPDIAVAQRTEENIRQLKREGSLRRSSRQTSLEPRRVAAVDNSASKAAVQDSSRKGSEPSVRGVTIQEISLQEAETLENSGVNNSTVKDQVELIHTFTTQNSAEVKVKSSTTEVTEICYSTKGDNQEKVELNRQCSVKIKGEQSLPTDESSVASAIVEGGQHIKDSESVSQGSTKKVEQQKGEILSVRTNQLEDKSVTTPQPDLSTVQKQKLDRGALEGVNQISENNLSSYELQSSVTEKRQVGKKSSVQTEKSEQIQEYSTQEATTATRSEISLTKQPLVAEGKVEQEQLPHQGYIKGASSASQVTKQTSIEEEGKNSKEKASCQSSIKENKVVAESEVLQKQSIQETSELIPLKSGVVGKQQKDSPSGDTKSVDEAFTPTQTGRKNTTKEKSKEKVEESKKSSTSRQDSVKIAKVGSSEPGQEEVLSDVPSNEELRQLKRRSSVIRRKSSVGMSTEVPPVFAKPLRSVECEPGENACFECVSEVPVIITWLKGNRPLDDTLADRVKITTKDHKHTLTILNCRDEDSGLYTAKITDEKFGVATCSAVLSIHELTPEERQRKIQELNSPQFWVKFHDTDLLKDTRVSFMFVVKGKPEPKLTFYHDGMILQEETDRTKILKQPDDTYEFCIERISDDDAGEYKVVAENKYGTAEVTAKVKVVDEKDLFRGIEGKRLLNPGEEPHFDWYMNGRPFTPDEKLKVLFREEEDTLALIFQHVTPEDAGLYSVIAQTSGGKISCSAELTVQGAIHQLLKEPCPPTITAELTDTEVGVGGSAMMELKVSGYPKPEVTWYKDGKELVAGGRFRFLYEDEESIALIIKNVTKEDAGTYLVKAVNDLGTVETKGRLIVKAPPKFLKKMVDMACMTEEKLAMEVIVDGSPKPEMKWYKDGQLIIASERIKFTELEDGRFQITIERVTLEDSGAYSVVASNAIGQMSEFWNLVAHQPAKIIRKLPAEHITDLGTKGNQLNFSVQGVPEPNVTCSSSAGKQLKVDNLGGGEYRVNFDCIERQDIKVKAVVKNDFGSDECECQVYVRRSAQIVSKLTNIEVKEGEDAMVKVKVDSYPKPSKVNWFIDGLEISGKKYEKSDSGDEYCMKIKKIERKDDSNKLNVQVKVENELGKDECSASITIKSKPKIKKELEAKYRLLESSKNQELTVEVDSASFPQPSGTWYHNGKEVDADAHIKITKKSSETYNLTFNVIKYEDAGEWSFKAENEVGEVWSKTTIIVEGKPTFKKGLPEILEIIESEKMELDVMVQDFCEENVKITWTLDSDIKLQSSEVYNKNESSAASKIVFVPTAGCQKLTVTATNKHGESETRSELIQVNLNPPVIKKPLEKETFIKDGQKDVKLVIEVEGMPPPKLTWRLNGEIIPGVVTNELIIPIFSSANVGQYSVEAVNVAGNASSAGSIKMLQTKPSFTKGLQPTYEFKEGLEDLVLSVDVDGSPIPVVVWMKDGQPISAETDPRVSITNADGKSTLRVKNIDPKDKGRYSVSLKNPNGACESSTNVGIKPTPRAPILVEPLEYPKDINKKEKLQIKTKIDGEPMPTVTFFHNDKPMQPHLWKVLPDGTVILTIDNVQGEDQGVYSLKLENDAGVKKVDTEPIVVHEPPQRPGIEPPLGTQRVVEGLPFMFSATLKGFPLPELTLEKDGVEVKDIHYDKDKKAFEYSKSAAEPGDSGKYKLIAKNASGQVASEGKLEVISKVKEGPTYEPKFIYELCDKTVDEGNELILMAKVDGNPLPTIRWEFNGERMSPEKYPQTFDGEKAIVRVPVAGRDNQGLYKCILENNEGTAESGSNVTVNKVYRPPSFAQKFTDQEQIPACDCKFGARVSGIPVPTARWFKDGTEILPDADKYKIKQEGDLVQLQVRNCGDKDKGLYTCLLTNNQGTAECKAKLDVVKEISHKPRGEIPYFLKTIGNTEVYPAMTAKFTACVGGFPNPEFEWYRGTDKVYESDRIKFERDGAGSGLLRLIINNVDLGDLADYTLKIWNEHGDAECSAYLKYDSLAALNKQKLGELYSGYEDTRPTAIPNRPLITNMTADRMTLKWNPCLPHVSRIPCTYLVEMCPVNDPDNWTTLYKGLKNNYCDVEFPNPNHDYKYRIRVQWGQNHISEPSPYAITMRNKFDTRPPQWKPILVPSIPRSYDLSRPPHEGYTHAPRFLNREQDYQYAELGHPSSVHFAVYGYPKPTLKFFRDGVEFTPEHTYLDNGLITLFINRMTEDREGEWECEARNSIGIARQKVSLRRADHPRFITRPKEVYAMNRRSGKITARIYGIPVPDIKIYKDWHLLPLTSETRVRLQIADVDEHTIDVSVSIEECMMRDEGLYSIVAVNVAGSIHSSAMIHVEESELDYYFNSNLKGKDVRFRNINVRNYYDFGDELGRGTQGVHHHVVERASGGSYISKTMITRYDPRRKDWIDAEYNVWNGVNHRYISRLHDAFYHDDTYIFISDICTGGDILHGLTSRDSFTEYDICHFIRQVLEGLEHLHVQHHIAHLSLTPLDLLLTHINSDRLRIIDFGLARKYYNKSLEYGHPEYVAPEIVRGEKNVGAWSDMWAVGIITYVLLSGHSPFLGLNDRETLENVKNGTWSFGDRFELISDKAKHFITRLLTYNYKERLDIQAALDHPWFHMLHTEHTDLPNILRDGHTSYYYKLKAWNENASCRTIYRRNPLQTAYTDPSRMVYPPNYNDEDDYKLPIPVSDHLKLNGYPRPDIDDFVSESHYQNGDETYLLQLRDTDFPARLRQYMKVAASQSPSFQFQVYNNYCDRNIPVIRERRKFTEIMDEEVDDEKSKMNDYGDGPWNNEPRRLRHEIGTRLDFQAEAEAMRSMKREGREPVFREKPGVTVNVRMGQEVILKVVTAGDPLPGIQWYKQDMMVISPGDNREIEDEDGCSTLTIKEIRETDLTNYKIVARNKSGQLISRFRLRLSDEPQGEPVPETINYEIESSPANISTEEIKVTSPIELLTSGKFGSVILVENSRLLKVCTELEFNTTRKLAHTNLFVIHEASQIGSSVLLEDNCLNYESSSNLLHYISSLDLYSEQLLMNFVAQILDGLQYLHWQGIALLNLEPGNVLVCKNQKIKLVDFSAAQPVIKIGCRVDCLTDSEFTAPEVLNGESLVMPQTDTWNIGLLIYILLSGVSPFLGETEEDTRQNITFVRFRFEHLYKNVSQEATRLIMLIFKRSPLKRPTADECLEHRWFQLSNSLQKKREQAVFDTTKIKEYYANYLEKRKSTQAESNLQDFTSKYGTIG